MEELYVVYHYCTIETFKNILKSKVLWLSDLTNSNDEQEVIRTFKNLWDGVKQRLKQTDLPVGVLNSSIEMIDKQFEIEITTDPPYGICFCREEDLLSQWIEYGDGTKGLSLGFDLNWFIHNLGIKQQKPHPSVIQSNAIGCDDVIYHSEDFEIEMADVCYSALKEYGVQAWITAIRPTFKHFSGFVKNPAFEQESEIRIVYYPMEDDIFTENNVNVSSLIKHPKSHYEIPWLLGKTQALKSICIGHNCILSEMDVKELLKENGIETDLIIQESQCSYRIR